MPVMNATFLAIATVRGQRRSPATSLEFQDFGISYSDYPEGSYCCNLLFFLGGGAFENKGGVSIDTAGATPG